MYYFALVVIAASIIGLAVWAFQSTGKAIFYRKDQNYRPILLKVFIVACCFVALLFCIAVGIALAGKDAGVFGDFFGGVTNPILTFLTIVGLLITIVMQQDATREARDQASRQMFDASFFQMLTLLNSMVNEFEVVDDEGKRLARGKDCFRHMHKTLKANYNHGFEVDEMHKTCAAYATVYGEFGYILPHYFRVVFNIIKSVERSKLSGEEKLYYVRLLRAQLSNHETGIIFYNSLTTDGQKFKLYIANFKLMNNFPQKLYLRDDHFELLKEKPFAVPNY